MWNANIVETGIRGGQLMVTVVYKNGIESYEDTLILPDASTLEDVVANKVFMLNATSTSIKEVPLGILDVSAKLVEIQQEKDQEDLNAQML